MGRPGVKAEKRSVKLEGSKKKKKRRASGAAVLRVAEALLPAFGLGHQLCRRDMAEKEGMPLPLQSSS